MKPFFASWRVKWAANQFAKKRDDWYEYLADMIADSAGHRSIRDIFEADARRYGPHSARGILSEHWAHGIGDSGDLGQAALGTLPRREVAELAALQRRGQAVFADGLRDMAAIVRLSKRLQEILKWTLMAGVISALVLWLVVMVAIPYFSAPELRGAFPEMPTSYYGPYARTFFGLAGWIRDKGAVVWLASIGAIALLIVSFPHFDGRLRRWLDTWGPYRLYRDIQAVSVVSSVATSVKQRAGITIPIRDALDAQRSGASRWLGARIQAMVSRLDDDGAGASIFNVGLFDRETYWYLEDLTGSLGLDLALQKTRVRLETSMLKRIEHRALIMRWVLLIFSVLSLMGILAWHYAVIFDLRNAMMLANF